MRVDGILEQSNDQETKFFALQVLESVIKFRWGSLPDDQRAGIRNYASNLIIKVCADEGSFRSQKMYLNKMNMILVAILKHDWPHKWTSFLPDIVGASKQSEILCQNTMVILRLLSEEVFDFSRGQLTQAKIKELKCSLNREFQLVHELCMFVFANSQKPALLNETLRTLYAFLSWIGLGYIFQSDLIETLLKFFGEPVFRNNALLCLTEVGSLAVSEQYDPYFQKLFGIVMNILETAVLPPGTNIAQAYENGSEDDQEFVKSLTLFLTGFYKPHIGLLEASPELHGALLLGLSYLVQISYIDDIELFKTCMDYWNLLVSDVFSTDCTSFNLQSNPFSFGGMEDGKLGNGAGGRKGLYAATLSQLRLLMTCRMAKPEEVIVVEDENGNIVKETMKDNAVLTLYKIMKETLTFLSHLDHDDTERQMVEKLAAQLNGTELTPGWQRLNTLCWAIGSISGSMAEEQENRFLVTVIRDLLNLCEITKGKDNKAVIASNIMYVVGQYPRFLRAHWKFLKTVVKKLFEFMHETFEGVQDMACDTFLKICTKCKRKFVIVQVGESMPFIVEILCKLDENIKDLANHQIHVFYETIGMMIGAEGDPQRRGEYLQKLMEPPNTRWQAIIAAAHQNVESLKQQETIKHVAHILQTNLSVCSSLGQPFQSQMQHIFGDMLNVYKMYSELISASIASGGQYAARSSIVKAMRSVKKVVLRLLEVFVDKAEDESALQSSYLPALMDPVLGDYKRNVPDARDAEVLSLFTAIVKKLQAKLSNEVPLIFDAVFECTLDMITKNFEDHPDHRLKFFGLLEAIVEHCFQILYQFNDTQLKLVTDSIVWAFRHTERNVAETGLQLLLKLLMHLTTTAANNPAFAAKFYQTYYLHLLREVLDVMTDTYHKPGFPSHVQILQLMFSAGADPTLVAVPLWDATAVQYSSNEEFLRTHIAELLSKSFPNIQAVQLGAIVAGMFDFRKENAAFKNHLRDFLVQTKEFATSDNAELYAEEAKARLEAEKTRLAAIPGMVKPSDQEYGMDD